jgi:hypothetical protein
VHVRQEGIVDLHVEAGIDDGLVFLVQAVGERAEQAPLVRVMLVLRVRQRARRRDDRQEGARDLRFGRRGLEVGDVALDLHVRVAQRAVDHEARAEPLVQARSPIVFRIEFGKGDAVLPAADGRHGILGLFGGQRPAGDAAEAVMDVKGPVAALAEFAVTDDVDARLGLLAHDRVDRVLQTRLVGVFVVGGPILDLVQELDQLRGPHQAAHVGGEDAVGARCHFAPSRSALRAAFLSLADRPGSNG